MKLKSPEHLKVALLTAALSFTAIAPMQASASGFPTLDIANLTQSAQDYLNQLEQYNELLLQSIEDQKQTILQQSQLVQLVDTYKQALISYDHMLRQMEGLKNKLNPREYADLTNKFKDIVNTYPGNLPDFTSDEWLAKGKELSRLYDRVNRESELHNLIDDVPFDADSRDRISADASRDFTRGQVAVGQSIFVDKINTELVDGVERFNKVSSKRQDLGAEDHLATLQVMAEQNELNIEAMQQANAISTAQLQYANQLPNYMFSRQNIARKASLKEAKEKLDAPIIINNAPLSDY